MGFEPTTSTLATPQASVSPSPPALQTASFTCPCVTRTVHSLRLVVLGVVLGGERVPPSGWPVLAEPSDAVLGEFPFFQCAVQDRHHEEGDQSNQHAAHGGKRHGDHDIGASALRGDDGSESQDGRCRCH